MFSLAADAPILAASEVVAKLADARITALLVEVAPGPVYTLQDAMEGGVLADALAQTHKEFEQEKRNLDALCASATRHVEVRDISIAAGRLGAAMGAEARHADLTIMLRPGDAPLEELRTAMFEGVLLGSGRPVLLIPPEWRGGPIGRNIVVGWNDKREAARALADAAPFLEHAENITILCVSLDADRTKADTSGEAVVSRLATRGKHAKLRHAGEFGFSDGATLMGQAGGLQADLIVMGGYGSPRLLEYVVGGATREAMKTARIPILMSH
jgi:nucleotide-binding universal stress UspA family protein